jgi:hypothetical protein
MYARINSLIPPKSEKQTKTQIQKKKNRVSGKENWKWTESCFFILPRKRHGKGQVSWKMVKTRVSESGGGKLRQRRVDRDQLLILRVLSIS